MSGYWPDELFGCSAARVDVAGLGALLPLSGARSVSKILELGRWESGRDRAATTSTYNNLQATRDCQVLQNT